MTMTRMKSNNNNNDNDYNTYFVTNKLKELSAQERSELEHEIHGVADIERETPERIQQKRMEMDQALDALVLSSSFKKNKKKQDDDQEDTLAYETALSQSKEYVDQLKLAVLRCEKFHSPRAAARLIRFFDLKQTFFGTDKLGHDLQLQDLGNDGLDTLQKGSIILLPQRDRSGRTVVVINGFINQQLSTNAVMKVLFFQGLQAMKDSSTQQRGIVVVYYGFGQTKTISGRPLAFWKTWRASPIRIVACHYCGDASVHMSAIRQFCILAERFMVCRLRSHYGPQIECMYQLMTFGIPVNEAMPIRNDGTLDLTLHHAAIRKLKLQEETSTPAAPVIETTMATRSNATTTFLDVDDDDDDDDNDENQDTNSLPNAEMILPGEWDILMGKGRQPKSSQGALKLHELLQELHGQYDKAPKFEKALIVEQILNQLKEFGTRIIKLSPRGFEICTDKIAKDRISHGFRNRRMKHLKAAAAAAAASSTSTTPTTNNTTNGKKINDKSLQKMTE